MNIHPFKALLPQLDLIPSPDSFFGSIKAQFTHYAESGFFKQTSKNSLFILQIESPMGNHTGIIANNSIEDLNSNKILVHEKTLNSKEQTMMNFLLQARAMVKPVLLTYPKVKGIDDFIAKYIDNNKPFQTVDFDNGITHSIWKINGSKDINYIQQQFLKKVPKCYIADGHHRCATMANLASKKQVKGEKISIDKMMCTYFSFENLKIFDYNKIVDIQGDISPLSLMAKLSEIAKVTRLKSKKKPTKKGRIHMTINGEWFELKWRKSILQQFRKDLLILDAHLVNHFILYKILKIEDVRTSPKISYSEGIKPLKNVVKPLMKEKYKIGIFLPPLEVSDIITAADNGLSLPPKSTWFEPRIKSGLINCTFDNV